MIHHRGVNLSELQTADLLICHETQQDLSLSTHTSVIPYSGKYSPGLNFRQFRH